MKKYNVANYIRYKEDLKASMPKDKPYKDYTRKELIIKFLPLVETMGRKFSTSDQASGVLTIMDFIQAGSEALTKAVDRLDWETLEKSDDIEKTLKSFFSKRIKLWAEKQFIRAAHGGTGEAKAAGNYAAAIRPTELAKAKGYDQVLWLDAAEHKYIQEVGTMNIFFKISGEFITPKLDGSVLDGITRKSIIKIAEDNNILKKDLVKWNEFKGYTLRPGMILFIQEPPVLSETEE